MLYYNHDKEMTNTSNLSNNIKIKESKTMTNKLNVNVKKLNERATIPADGSEKAAGADLYACWPEGVDSITVNAGETVKFGTGVVF